MKTLKFSLLIGLMLSLAFTSCKKDPEPEQKPEPTASTKDFFTIENATFSTGSLPQGTVSLISDLTINGTVINGGSTIVSFYSSEKVKTVFVAVKGMEGYYKYDFPENYEVLRAASARYYYELILHIAQELKEQGFTISISCLTANGVTSTSEDTDKIKVKEVGTGKLQISLSWDQYDDLDLHLLEPSGNKIYYGNRTSVNGRKLEFEYGCYLVNKYTEHDVSSLDYDNYEDQWLLEEYMEDVPWDAYYDEYEDFIKEKAKQGGNLDLDSNAACLFIDKINNENITYESDPAMGIYYVAVDLFEKCTMSSRPGAKYSVTVNYNKQLVTISNKQTGQFDADDEGSFDDSSKYHIIGAFEITASGIKPVAVTDNPFSYYNDYDDDDYYGALRKGPADAKAKLSKNKKK
jgi:hypothetical protein